MLLWALDLFFLVRARWERGLYGSGSRRETESEVVQKMVIKTLFVEARVGLREPGRVGKVPRD